MPADPAGTEPAWMPVISGLVLDPGLQSMSFRFRVSRNLPVFRGHFPEAPIVPGIMQVGWVVEIARAHRLAGGCCTGIVTAKFRRLLLPGMEIEATVRRAAGTRQLRFGFHCRGDEVSTGRLQFGDGDD